MKSLTERELAEALRRAWMRGHRNATEKQPHYVPRPLTIAETAAREEDVAQLVSGK